MTNVSLTPVPLGSDLLDQVWNLYRKNSATLGFLPRGALDEFAHAGCVLAANRAEEVLGYMAWRRSRNEVVLVHLCVAEAHRSTACAGLLLKELIRLCRDDVAIRLRCREDYAAANRLWPKHGFAVDDEKAGRGADGAALLMWRRVNKDDAPLLEAIKAASPRCSRVIAIDANVFFDLMKSEAPHHEESSALLADWVDDANVCITRELRNEISRRAQSDERQKAQIFLRKFSEIACHPDELDGALSKIGAVLPQAEKESDHSDRRQIVHAWLAGANFFATRDSVLLDHADDIWSVTGMFVLRPSDVVARLQGDFIGRGYAPVRLHGTKVERYSPASEVELYPFQNFASGESKATWLSRLRGLRSQPDRYSIEAIGVRGESPRVVLSIERTPSRETHIGFLRSLSGPLTGTLIRRAVADVTESAQLRGATCVVVDEPVNDEVSRALHELEFYPRSDGRLARYTMFGIADEDGARKLARQKIPEAAISDEATAEDIEAKLWPFKVSGAGIQNFLVPIRRQWAAALFERNLAADDLFDVPEKAALALENVYYSASSIKIPKGSRIIWYVSGDVQEVRAISACLGTDAGTATELSRRYHRLGAYSWRDVLNSARGDAQAELHAYRFAKTEMLVDPVSWRRLEELIYRHSGTRNRVASPVRVPEDLFLEIYRNGMRILG